MRWYVAYPLSLRHIEKMMQERGVFVDHAIVDRWAINLHDVPGKITIDKSGANSATIESVMVDACVDILMRKNQYLNNIVEQDHRAIKRITRPMLDFKSFWSARIIIAGNETMHMIRKGQMDCPEGRIMSATNQLYSLAA